MGHRLASSTDPQSVADVLFGRRHGSTDINAIHWPGIYALFIDVRTALAPLTVPDSGLLYIRLSISKTELRNQFTGSSTSTLRRSLGALLKGELELKVLPHHESESSRAKKEYLFDKVSEHRLSDWMERHVAFGFAPAQRDLRLIERRLIKQHQPALNLTSWSNPQRRLLSELRRDCADERRSQAAAVLTIEETPVRS